MTKKEKRAAYMREYTQKNKDKINAQRRERLLRLKEENSEEYRRRRVLANEATKRYEEKHRDRIMQTRKDNNWYYDKERKVDVRARSYNKTFASQVIRGIKYRCKTKDIPFNLDKEWYLEEYNKGCSVTGKEFDEPQSKSPWVAHVDRIVPELGYLKSNCRLVCGMYNQAKGRWTDLEVQELLNSVPRLPYIKSSLLMSVEKLTDA